MYQRIPKYPTLFIFHSKVCLQFLLIVSVGTIDLSLDKQQLSHIGWGERCRLRNRKGDPPLKPREKCNEGVGIFCQKYAAGSFCACRSDNWDLSYDVRSKECRVMVGEYCHYIDVTQDPYGHTRQPYSSKCHENAECIQVGSWAHQALEEDPVCRCKSGYFPSHDLTQCLDPNNGKWRTSQANSINFSYFVTILALLISQLTVKRNTN